MKPAPLRDLVRRALLALGVQRLVLGVHDAALPGDPADDLGRGAPLARGGRGFLDFIAALGFDGLQLGPQGETTAHDASPYDGTIFSRNTLSIALAPLAEAGLLGDAEVAAAVAGRPEGSLVRVAHQRVHAQKRRVLDAAFARFQQDRSPALVAALREFSVREEAWLARDGLYAALAAEHGDEDWLRWPERDRTLWANTPGQEEASAARRRELASRHEREIARVAFVQWLAHEQHLAFHASARALGVRLYGDLQIGVGHQDVWSYGSLFLPGLRMGAPPSRTNPSGQPWNYAVLDPAQYGTAADEGPALAFVRARVGKLLSSLDGLRIDHPHGLIDPWVYRCAQPDVLRAVQEGARLFSSPQDPDLPELEAWAIARPDQLNRDLPAYSDGWVRTLDDAQVERYAVLFDALVAAARERGLQTRDLIAEVLSTQPYPIGRVLTRHGLGRFRVTQKAGLSDPNDVYRSENAAPSDWIMVGNHDTEPIWRVAQRWQEKGLAVDQARALAARLIPAEADRASWAERTAQDPLRLARARLAELFIGPATNVFVYFTDLFGLREAYNRPGIVDDQNWSLRVPPDYARAHAQAASEGRALDLPRALYTAMEARGESFVRDHSWLMEELARAAAPEI